MGKLRDRDFAFFQLILKRADKQDFETLQTMTYVEAVVRGIAIKEAKKDGHD